MDLDLSNKKIFDSQNGIGGLAGIGINYDFNFGVSIFVNPYIKTHALIPFSKEDNHQRLTDSGVRIGLSINLN